MKKKTNWFFQLCLITSLVGYSSASVNCAEIDTNKYQIGKQLYTDGLLPSGEPVKAVVQGDIQVEGNQLICETCHRRSGMGSTEGQQVVPAIAGHILFKPLKLPTSRPPEPPIYRDGYTKQSLMRAIRDGVDVNGEPLDPFMPRYNIDEATLDGLTTYLDTLSQAASPGVTETTIHFATVVLASNKEEDNKALLDVMSLYEEQKNTETRHESKRAENAPWHKEWMFKPYRKWQIHTWELTGAEESWPSQLEALYAKQPVFALLNGLVPTGWEKIHNFCESQSLPCLFPTTQSPVVAEKYFYSIYLNKGAAHEGEAIASYLSNSEKSVNVIQYIDTSDQLSMMAANSLRDRLQERDIAVTDVMYSDVVESSQQLEVSQPNQVTVLWLGPGKTDELLTRLSKITPTSIPDVVLSTRFYGTTTDSIPSRFHDSVKFIHTSEMPQRLKRLLMRSTGWFKSKRIYNSDALEIQANAFFALKVAGDALKSIRGYFYRDYFIEKVEHMIDDIPYTSIYPRVSLAPDQRFISRGFYVAGIDNSGKLVNFTDWKAP
ncbi:MAG: hypothetical protein KZQ96_08685 [Candidatus Thiodiazotropha sp. (ex Lucinoma borealis)]|nr:hypothetical protein [Candidatus Thiodiazotropha sp. (ex Lucinoma borealis)]MCU7868044.1 hypothetical protein [Candidatus Thiodiazotropha sp. (ex Lucinoma borealis)]